MNKFAFLIFIVIPFTVFAAGQSPYAGEEQRSIKSLSAREITSLRNGEGMGFAKLAELNHFPGPKHVLELSTELDLSPSQLAATEALFEKMQHDAIALGEELILAEMRLDQAFEKASIDQQKLEVALLEIGRIRAQLRYVHLESHLQQKQLLSPDQRQKYDTLRGYKGTNHGHHGHSNTSEQEAESLID